jgi:NADH-quinone oxidoreductase subunit H
MLAGDSSLQMLYGDPVGHYVIVTVAALLLVFVLVTAAAYTVWFERVTLGAFQRRPGPNRVGPRGLMQSAADGIKCLFKEDIRPSGVDGALFAFAPIVALGLALLAWAVIPVGVWYGVSYWIANANVGVLLIFAVSSLNVYTIVVGGYASNSKYSLLGGLRGAAQLVSYELPLGLSLVPVFMIVGSLRLQDIANYTVHWGPYSGPIPLIILAPLSFLLYMMAAVAETNRAPFDLPEAEQELVGGYHTEYSSFRWLLFMVSEYLNMITVSAVASVVFLGAWWGPVLPPFLWMLVKIVFFLFVYIWLRATLPRLRYDHLMRLGWKVLLPLAMLNIVVTSVIVVAVQA